jgi:DNA-directed RNA polymerase specialized sigma24 family protein
VNPLPVDVLDPDWRHELVAPHLRRRFRVWREAEPALAAFRDPAALLRFLRGPGSGAHKDEVLCALLRRARREPVAGRVVLEAMLPGLKKLAGRLLTDVRDREELWSVLLACAWERIRTYPVERRPRRVAANVLLDSLNGTLATFSRERREPASGAGILAYSVAAVPAPAGVDALLDAAIDAGAVSREEAELILATRVDETPLSVLARSQGVNFDTLKHRRGRAERRLQFFLGRPCPVEGGESTFLGCSGRW